MGVHSSQAGQLELTPRSVVKELQRPNGLMLQCFHPTLPLLMVLVCVLGMLPNAAAESLRVTTWDVGASETAQIPAASLEQIATTLRLLEPDVVLLQGVRDWQMCQQVAEALRPARYRVLVCSALGDGSPEGQSFPQVAVLAKLPAYFTWSSTGQPGTAGGVAFAAIQMSSQRLGFFSLLSGNPAANQSLAQGILSEIAMIGRWETNQVQIFTIGASLDSRSRRSLRSLQHAAGLFEQAGLVDATEDLPPARNAMPGLEVTGYHDQGVRLFAGPNGFPASPQKQAVPMAAHEPITCDLELDPAKVSLALDIRSETQREKRVRGDAATTRAEYWGGSVLGIGVLSILALRFRAQRRTRPLAPQPSRLPVRPTPQPAAVRPILFAEPQPKRIVLNQPGISPPRPVLRLQPRTKPSDQPLTPSTPSVPDLPAEAPLPGEPDLHHEPAPEEVIGQKQPRLDPQVRQGVIRELSAWLKHKLVRRLVEDRSQLMQAQHLATRMANSLDSRLARIEAQIQQQNQAYVRRVEELQRELSVAREENRELIRERIAQVKAEMEATRARMLAEAQLDNRSLRL